jgi:hypothetical protein
MKISKDLFEIVLQEKFLYNDVTGIYCEVDGIRNCVKYTQFFFDCKAWAIFMEYDICSGYDSDMADGMYFCKIENYKFHEIFAEYNKTEIELVFEACEYILKTTPKDLLEYFTTTKVRVNEKQSQH